MTNEEKYKTIEERAEKFSKFCDSKHTCRECQFYVTLTNLCGKPHNCKFHWLALEADEEEKCDKPIITNEEKYRTIEDRAEAYQKFCKQSLKGCSECPALRYNVPCDLVWLTLKAEDQENMTNKEKYKTLKEQFQAFRKFCNKSYRRGCRRCLDSTAVIGECWKEWLKMGVDDEKND